MQFSIIKLEILRDPSDKNFQDIYTEDYTTLLREIKNTYNKMKR